MASRVQIGHTMITENGIKKVTNIENVEQSGIYAPATSDIGLFVNGIYVTGISKFEHVDWQVILIMSMYKQLKRLPVIGEYISQRNSQGLINYWSLFDNLTYGFGGIGEKMAKYFIGY